MFCIEDWGVTHYLDAYSRQLIYVKNRIEGKCKDTLILTEHIPVFTVGKKQESQNHIKWDIATCHNRGIEVILTNRGGGATYHGVGQIIGYPII